MKREKYLRLNKLFITILFMSFFCSCKKDKFCIDQSLVNEEITCIEIYKPVCGCDGNTYENDCYAFRAGITSYIDGECTN